MEFTLYWSIWALFVLSSVFAILNVYAIVRGQYSSLDCTELFFSMVTLWLPLLALDIAIN